MGLCIAHLAGLCTPIMGVLFKSVLLIIPVVNLWILEALWPWWLEITVWHR